MSSNGDGDGKDDGFLSARQLLHHQATSLVHAIPVPCRCLAACKEWEECLLMLGGLDVEGPQELGFAVPRATPGTLNYLSAVCVLRGRVFDALENFPRAVKWYKAALKMDPYNYEVRWSTMQRR